LLLLFLVENKAMQLPDTDSYSINSTLSNSQDSSSLNIQSKSSSSSSLNINKVELLSPMPNTITTTNATKSSSPTSKTKCYSTVSEDLNVKINFFKETFTFIDIKRHTFKYIFN
jgi:hypothetical protein